MESDTVFEDVSEMPDECALELTACERKRVLGLLTTERISVSQIMSPETYSSLNRLLRVTVNVLKFNYLIRSMTIDYQKLRTQAEILWLKGKFNDFWGIFFIGLICLYGHENDVYLVLLFKKILSLRYGPSKLLFFASCHTTSC